MNSLTGGVLGESKYWAFMPRGVVHLTADRVAPRKTSSESGEVGLTEGAITDPELGFTWPAEAPIGWLWRTPWRSSTPPEIRCAVDAVNESACGIRLPAILAKTCSRVSELAGPVAETVDQPGGGLTWPSLVMAASSRSPCEMSGSPIVILRVLEWETLP